MTTNPLARAKPPNDLEMLAQVEQWMATIRGIGREESANLESASERLAHLLAPSTE